MSRIQQGQREDGWRGESDDSAATVLVVEDQQQIADAYTRALGAEYDVRTATGGEEALAKVDDEVDVVLLDRRMPEMSGDEVLDALRDRGVTSMVAMVTAVKPDTDILGMPFDEYLTKPAGTQDLQEVTDVLLERAAYGSDYREFFRLTVKKVTLENANKDWTDAYGTICQRLSAYREEVDVTVEDSLLPQNCSFHS